MARVLIVVPPLVGHVAPLAGVAAEIAARGHTVAWAGSPRTVAAVTGPGQEVHPAGPDPDGALTGRPPGLRAFAALQHLWEGFLVPLAERMLPAVDEVVRRFRPDVLLCDQQAFAGPLAALRHGLPWVTSASTSAELDDPLAAFPKVADWVGGLQTRLRADAGVTGGDLRRSPHGTLCFSCAELAGRPDPAAGPVHLVGACVGGRADGPAFSWQLLDRGRTPVLVTLGTANGEAGERFLDAARAGLAGLGDVQPIVVVPGAPEPPARAERPPREIVVDRVPQLRLLRHVGAVVSHGGHNTVVESLHAGRPVVLAPIRDDQPIIADQVERAGAGRTVRFDRADADEIAGAVRDVLSEPAHAAAAARVGRALADAGGAPAATDVVERVLHAADGRAAALQ